jgi:hypothetical protein
LYKWENGKFRPDGKGVYINYTSGGKNYYIAAATQFGNGNEWVLGETLTEIQEYSISSNTLTIGSDNFTKS